MTTDFSIVALMLEFTYLCLLSMSLEDIACLLSFISSRMLYFILLKAELWTSDFQHLHWFVGHRLLVHTSAVSNMVK